MTISTNKNQYHFYVASHVRNQYLHIDCSDYSSEDNFNFHPHRKITPCEFSTISTESLHAAVLKTKRVDKWK